MQLTFDIVAGVWIVILTIGIFEQRNYTNELMEVINSELEELKLRIGMNDNEDGI